MARSGELVALEKFQRRPGASAFDLPPEQIADTEQVALDAAGAS